MLDIKTVMPNKHTQLVQTFNDRYMPLPQVLNYDSSKCTVLATNKSYDGVSFIMRSPSDRYFIQTDVYASDGAFGSVRTECITYITMERAISSFLSVTDGGHRRLTLEEAFGVTAEEI